MNELKEEYLQLRTDYSSLPLVNDITFDTELVSHKIQDLKPLKEHLLFSHPILSTILSKLFRLIWSSEHIPDGFKYNYIVPIPKPKDCHSKPVTCDDFRGIAISPIVSKVFE